MNKNWQRLFIACSLVLVNMAPENSYSKGPHPGGPHGIVYPPIGAHFAGMPKHHHTGRFGGRIYHYYAGIWYGPARNGYTVIVPPVGISVPVLPPGYSTVWVSGIPYYYANNVYYVWSKERGCYLVAEMPRTRTEVSSTGGDGQFYTYPKEGQDEKQQADDRYECHKWATEQTAYDPTRPEQNVSVETLRNERANYMRAMKACLEAKGYSVG